MALTPEQIDVLYMRNGLGKFHQPVDSLQCEYDHCIHDFARAIEAEVRKDDEALIRQMLEALEQVVPHVDQLVCYGSTAAEWPLNTAPRNVQSAIAAARARLEKAP